MNDYPAFNRERRPTLIELAAALLIVGGIAQMLLRVAALSQGFELPVLAVSLGFGLDTLAIVTGLLVRSGTAWIVCVNVVVILAFIDFREVVLGASIAAALFLALDLLAVVAVVRHKAWFDRDRAAERGGGRTARAAVGWTADDVSGDRGAPADPRTGRG